MLTCKIRCVCAMRKFGKSLLLIAGSLPESVSLIIELGSKRIGIARNPWHLMMSRPTLQYSGWWKLFKKLLSFL